MRYSGKLASETPKVRACSRFWRIYKVPPSLPKSLISDICAQFVFQTDSRQTMSARSRGAASARAGLTWGQTNGIQELDLTGVEQPIT